MLIYKARDEFGQLCEVRRAGKSLRLYTDGTFHSQFNPERLLENNLWDLLWLPTLTREHPVRRVLVLGVGGGAVVRKLQSLFPAALIIGVDISRQHLHIARHIFKAQRRDTLLLEADALKFVELYQGPKFDVVLDDLFATNAGNPERIVPLDKAWLAQLKRLLTTDGQLIANFGSPREFAKAASTVYGCGGFTTPARFSHRRYDNVIGSFARCVPPEGNSERVLNTLARAAALREVIAKSLRQKRGGRLSAEIAIGLARPN